MADEELTPQEKKLQAAVEEFSRQLDALEAKRFELIKKVVGRIEKDKIREILESLK